MLGRLLIDDVRPRAPGGHPAKGSVGERVAVSAQIVRDGHDLINARVGWRPVGVRGWSHAPLHDVGNDRWAGWFEPAALGAHAIGVGARLVVERAVVELKAGDLPAAAPDRVLQDPRADGDIGVRREE